MNKPEKLTSKRGTLKQHTMHTELESAQANSLINCVSAQSLLQDLKVLCEDYYNLNFTTVNNEAVLTYFNDQSFTLTITEMN